MDLWISLTISTKKGCTSLSISSNIPHKKLLRRDIVVWNLLQFVQTDTTIGTALDISSHTCQSVSQHEMPSVRPYFATQTSWPALLETLQILLENRLIFLEIEASLWSKAFKHKGY